MSNYPVRLSSPLHKEETSLSHTVLYASIQQTKLDTNFVTSLNDYLDRLKAHVYKDLIRRETLLRNGKTHSRNLMSLIRCICKISYEQAHETSTEPSLTKHAVIYTMTAIDYILQSQCPQSSHLVQWHLHISAFLSLSLFLSLIEKPLFHYLLNEFISMWLHENLRLIQEDLSIIAESGTSPCFLPLTSCVIDKLQSLCALNWVNSFVTRPSTSI